MAAGATYEPIATTTLSSAASSITFSSIAASWTDLRLVVTATTVSGGQNLFIDFNSDNAGSNYSVTTIQGNGSTAASYTTTSEPTLNINYGTSGTSATIPQLFTVDIFSYAGSTYKTSLYTALQDQNGSGAVKSGVGLWRSTSAITQVRVTSGVNLAAGTTATLYGIKAA